MREETPSDRGDPFPLFLIVLKCALGGWVLHLGFSHVSDDDYSRVVIAELFAHSPKLDPSGTSWLPFPFWIMGAFMAAFGRSLIVARAASFALGALAVAPFYLALRIRNVSRFAACASVLLGMAMPWNAWLGVATVPESFTPALMATGAILIGGSGALTLGALALFVASLSRYEAWPLCAVFSAFCAWRAFRQLDFGLLIPLLIGVAGPVGWMLWNAQAHGSAVHFLARVASYHRAVGGAPESYVNKILFYPSVMWTAAPWLVSLGAVGLAAMAMGDGRYRARWTGPVLGTIAVVVFLIVGNAKDGAPTHHPERAVTAVVWIVAAWGVDGMTTLAKRFIAGRSGVEAIAVALIMALSISFAHDQVTELREFPGRRDDETRDAQVARGLALRRDSDVTQFRVEPCEFEHFALLAAYGAPENAEIAPASHKYVSSECPRIDLR